MARFLGDFGALAPEIDRCIRCGYCNSVCPTSNVNSAYRESKKSRGRLVMLQSLRDGTGDLTPYTEDFKNLIDLCFACQRCVPVCPASIPIPDLMIRARYAYHKAGGPNGFSIGERIFSSYDKFERIGSKLHPVSTYCIRNRAFRWLMGLLTGIAPDGPLPGFSHTTFSSWFRNRNAKKSSKKVVYVPDAYAEYNQPELGQIAVEALERLGFEVIVPDLESTSLPAIEFGHLERAQKTARQNMERLFPLAKEGLPIVATTPAVPSVLKSAYPKLLDEDEKVSRVAAQTHDIHDFLMSQVRDGVAKVRSEPRGDVLYHYCCLSKSLKTLESSRGLLSMCGFHVSIIEECCGGAGVWSMLKKNRQLSLDVGAPLFQRVRVGERVVTESETCKLQIESGSGRLVEFPLELVAPHLEATS